MFLIKIENFAGKCKIEYTALDDFWRKEEKLVWLKNKKIKKIHFEDINPDKNNIWINLMENYFDSLLALCSKESKSGNKVARPCL